MKKRIYILKQILVVLILNTGFDKIAYCQVSRPDTIPAKIIKLEQGCRLVLDTKIDTNDSIFVEIIGGMRDILPRIQKLIPADSITIDMVISDEIVPAWGMGARTTSGHSVLYNLDPDNPNFSVKFLLDGFVHEALHISRLRMPQWQLTMLECMITEGLADHFMIEVLNCEQPAWSRALTEEQIQQYMVKVKPILFMKHESWTDKFNEKYFLPWFFGRTGDDPIPGGTGYTLGWRMVENYLKVHPEVRASSLVITPAEAIASLTPELTDSK
jgi:hypothetical protein